MLTFPGKIGEDGRGVYEKGNDLPALKAAIAEGAARPLARATTLPPAAYTSPALLDFEVREIFAKEWICVGRVEEIPRVGDYFTIRILDEPLIVVRAKADEIRVLANVCRHKFSAVASGRGHTRGFVCPYHAWTYDLEGALVGTCFMETAEGFDPGEHGLHRVRSAVWRGFISVNIDGEAPPLADHLAELDARTRNYHMDEMYLVCGGEEVWANNWKLLVENFTETYHTFHTHRDSISKYAPSELTETAVAGGEAYSYGLSHIRRDLPPSVPHHPDLTPDQRYLFSMIGIFPTHLIALAPDRLFYMCLAPIDVDHVRTKWGVACFGPEPAAETVEYMDTLYRQVNEEDRARLEGIQCSLRSRFAATGRISDYERMNWEFARYLARQFAA